VTTAFLNYDKKDDQVREMREHLLHFQKVQKITPQVLNLCKLMRYVSSPSQLKKRSDGLNKTCAYIVERRAIKLQIVRRNRRLKQQD
jgi:hypothetical protein